MLQKASTAHAAEVAQLKANMENAENHYAFMLRMLNYQWPIASKSSKAKGLPDHLREIACWYAPKRPVSNYTEHRVTDEEIRDARANVERTRYDFDVAIEAYMKAMTVPIYRFARWLKRFALVAELAVKYRELKRINMNQRYHEAFKRAATTVAQFADILDGDRFKVLIQANTLIAIVNNLLYGAVVVP